MYFKSTLVEKYAPSRISALVEIPDFPKIMLSKKTDFPKNYEIVFQIADWGPHLEFRSWGTLFELLVSVERLWFLRRP
jgi:hypothetical protein